MKQELTEPTACSFCGTHGADTRFLMPGPAVAICGECIVVAVRMLAEGEGYFRTVDHVDAIEASGRRMQTLEDK